MKDLKFIKRFTNPKFNTMDLYERQDGAKIWHVIDKQSVIVDQNGKSQYLTEQEYNGLYRK